MLKLDNVRMIADHQVHGDDDPARPHVFYVMPRYPRIARLENGGLALRLFEYDAIRVAGDSQFGGCAAFDADLSMLPATQQQIRDELQKEVNNRFGAGAPQVELQTVPWLSGAVRLNLQQDGKIVERITGQPAPSLTGDNTACFFVELTVLGTAIFKDALSKGTASGIQVAYDLDHYCRLPEGKASGWWHADAFYSFWQDVHVEERFWGEDSYTEITRSTRYSSEVSETHFEPIADPGLTPAERKEFDTWVHDLITKQLEEGVKRNLLQAVQAVDPSVKEWTEGQDMEKVHREISNTQISDVRVAWTEAKAIIRQIHPQGMLPTVTSLKGPDGQPLKWSDYYTKVSVDEFLRTLRLNIRVDARFEDYGITLVEVKVRYPHGDNAKTVEATFTKDDAGKPQKAEFIVADGIRTFLWSYTVHFEGDSPPWTSEEDEDDGTDLNVKLSHLPVLRVEIANDINFEQVSQARVRVRYEGGDHPIERFFNLTDPNSTHTMLEMIGKPRTGPVTYQTTYTMKGDGRKITGPPKATDTDVISVEDPFRALKTVTFQAVGDLKTDIGEVTVQATYTEPANGYSQTFQVTLSDEGNTFALWSIPTIDEDKGTLSYQATIEYRNHLSEEVEVTDAKGTRFQIGRKFADRLDVALVPDLLDWSRLKMVSVSLRYPGTTPPRTDDFMFRSTDTTTKTWTVFLPPGAPASYSYTVTYFLLDGGRRTARQDNATDESVFLEIPA
ncbi:hypothetical protein ACTOB_004105 [Actinoplanes oblitus]|uniref:Uncharacterized protein n=1 Tax=Actinoplanes oblitus TaxID=3040509 RepID=A0ABY8WTZ9_9ACTN|nr:hypothetical protein [Actinoplanes oblitus]WIN00401.1 hypothetical protein ACTOB_004105 [Actinoplanes oblitus]